MKHCSTRALAARSLFVFLAALVAAAPAFAARVGILSNKFATQTAADFNNRIPSHSFTAIDTSTAVPSLASLQSSFDVLLVFEDETYANATPVGNAAAAFANSGRPVVLGAFYEQDRSDGPTGVSPHGWGQLESIDPNTTDGTGTPYAPRTLNIATMLSHPLTAGITSLSSAKFAGGNKAKAGTTVVAWWNQPNALGGPDPAIAFRITGNACVVMFGIAPSYPSLGTAGTDFGGDFHRAWKNVFDFAGNKCTPLLGQQDPGGTVANVPTLSQWGLLLTILLVAAVAVRKLRLRKIGRKASDR
jgi:hypothetical protein